MSDPQEIHGFDSLRWEDQQKIKEKIEGLGMLLYNQTTELSELHFFVRSAE